MNWPALATLTVVALAWVGVWWLRRRHLHFTVLALIALVAGVGIGLLVRSHVTAIEPLGQIYINLLLATVAPLIAIAIISAITSLGSVAQLRVIGVRSA